MMVGITTYAALVEVGSYGKVSTQLLMQTSVATPVLWCLFVEGVLKVIRLYESCRDAYFLHRDSRWARRRMRISNFPIRCGI